MSVGWLLFGLLACPADPLCVTVVDPQADRLVVQLREGKSCTETPTIKEVMFRDEAGTTLWRITSTGLPLEQVQYGVTPAGFQASAVEPLTAGQQVRVAVAGIGTDGFQQVVVQP